MDKIALVIFAKDSLFATLQREAERIDRSVSWILSRCLTSALTVLKALPADEASVTEMRTSVGRDPHTRSAILDFARGQTSELPPGIEKRQYYFERPLGQSLEEESKRLQLTYDEIIHWAWERHGEMIRQMPSETAEPG